MSLINDSFNIDICISYRGKSTQNTALFVSFIKTDVYHLNSQSK